MDVMEQQVLHFYHDFADGRFPALRRQLAPWVMYLALGQHNDCSAQGKDRVLQVLRTWHQCFVGFQVKGLSVNPAPDRLGEASGAQSCFRVKYRVAAKYVHTYTGLSGTAPAHGRAVSLAVTDHVWLDTKGRVMRIANTFNPRTLR